MSGVALRVHQDYGERTTTFERVQDVEPILEHNKRLRSIPQKSDWGRHIASIPNVIVEKWLAEEWNRGNTTLKMHGPEWNALLKRKLADPEWAYLRVDK